MPARPKAVRDVLQEIGHRIRLSRIAANLTQEAASQKARVDAKHWQEVEAGRANMHVETLVRIAKALGVSFWKLLRARVPTTKPPPRLPGRPKWIKERRRRTTKKGAT